MSKDIPANLNSSLSTEYEVSTETMTDYKIRKEKRNDCYTFDVSVMEDANLESGEIQKHKSSLARLHVDHSCLFWLLEFFLVVVTEKN